MSKFLAFALFVSHGLLAQNIRPGTPVYAGNGCPQGTVFISPDIDKISFSSFKLEHKNRVHCDIAIPLKVPSGYSVSIGPMMLKGSVSLEQNSSAQITIESFWAGSTGLNYSHRWSGPISRGFEIPTASDTSTLNWSPCGSDVNLRINASIKLDAINQDSNLIEVKELSTPPSISELIRWKRC